MKYNAEMNELYESYLLKISQGCHNSLELLYEKTKSYVYHYALSMVKNITDAEDIMQDTYVNIYKGYQRNHYFPFLDKKMGTQILSNVLKLVSKVRL